MSARFPATVGLSGAISRVRELTLEKTGNDTLDRVLARLVDRLRPLMASPRLDATTVLDVEFTAATAKTIDHRLGRAYRGWSVVRIRTAGATFFETAQATALDARTLTLTASATCVADVEVW